MNTHRRTLALLSRNGLYSAADYMLPQVALMLAAPLFLKYLGIAQLGIWMLSTAATTSGVLVSSAFGDAAIKYASEQSGHSDYSGMASVVGCTLALNLTFGAIFAFSMWAAAPLISHHLAHLPDSLVWLSTRGLRIGAGLLFIRTAEAVYVSTLRAIQRYDTAATITASTRTAALLLSVLLAALGVGVDGILIASVVLSLTSLCALCLAVRKLTGSFIILPSANSRVLRQMLSFGSFSWLQTLSGLAFNQIDRILVGLILGPAAVALYGICVQASQPVHAIASATFHSLFPYLSSRCSSSTPAELRHIIRPSFVANVLLSTALSLPVVLLARPFLAIWVGPAFAERASSLLRVIGVSFAFLSINVTAYYSLLALGRVRALATFNVLGAAAALSLMIPLARHFGLIGIAYARLVYGPITWCTYLVLHSALHPKPSDHFVLAIEPVLEKQ